MPDTTIEAFYLGYSADLDVFENEYTTENAGVLVGTTVGGPGAPLYDNIDSLTLSDSDGDGLVQADDLYVFPDNLTYAGYASGLDSTTHYEVTVTYADGSIATTEMVVLQDNDGRVFLAPFTSGHANNAVLDDGPIESIQIDAVAQNDFSGVNFDLKPDAFVTCFAEDTVLNGPAGPVPVRKVQVGDLVQTLDHGFQTVRWVQSRALVPSEKTTPVVVQRGALGPGVPTTALELSPQHCVMIRSPAARRMFGTDEILIPAKHLLGHWPGVTQPERRTVVRYLHFLFDRHEVLIANGAPAESLFPGPEVVKRMNASTYAHLCAILPGLNTGHPFDRARDMVRGRRAAVFCQRHHAATPVAV